MPAPSLVSVRADLRADGNVCQNCAAELWPSTSIERESVESIKTAKSARWAGVAVLAVCPGCKLLNVVPWLVST